MSRREMNDTSIVTRSNRRRSTGRSFGSRYRAFRPSSDDDARILAKLPVELAVTDVERDDPAAPRSSRTCVKPPVDAPMSSARMPDGFSPKVSSAWASFSPPRPTHG